MSWRTVIIFSRCKLDLKMGYLVDSYLHTYAFYPLPGFCSVGEKGTTHRSNRRRTSKVCWYHTSG